jgi:error-prone DNA polymerase
MTIGAHPMSLIRGQLPEGTVTSEDLWRLPNNSRVEAAGMVIARQRPATAKGILFMLLEDEWGTINLIVPPPAYDRHRMATRMAPFVRVAGRLERRDANMNIVVEGLWRLERPDLPVAELRTIEPPVERETGRGRESEQVPEELPAAVGFEDLGAVMPPPHSFGRRGR